jgi:hypothetical protein
VIILPELYLLFSHELTDQQKKDARELGVKEVYYLPDDLKTIWSQIPPEIQNIKDYIEPVKKWLTSRIKAGDYILIQGDFGATYQMVRWAFAKGLRPIYATTERKVVEIRNGDKVNSKKVFEHVRFRFYDQG